MPKRPLILVGAGLLMVGFFFSIHSIRALQARERGLRLEIAVLSGRVEEESEAVKDVQVLEQKAIESQHEIHRLESEFPASSPLVWIPEAMRAHFHRSGFADPIIRLNTKLKDPELPGYERIYWTVGLPLGVGSKDLRRVLSAVSELEAAERTVRVIDLTVQADPLNPESRTAAVTVVGLLRN